MSKLIVLYPKGRQASRARGRWCLGSRLANLAGRLVEWLRLPGFLRPLSLHDPATGLHLTVRTSERYTVVSVDGRDYYFNRASGSLDGTGSGALCACDVQAGGRATI